MGVWEISLEATSGVRNGPKIRVFFFFRIAGVELPPVRPGADIKALILPFARLQSQIGYGKWEQVQAPGV